MDRRRRKGIGGEEGREEGRGRNQKGMGFAIEKN